MSDASRQPANTSAASSISSQLARIRHEFAAAWNQGQAPNIGEFYARSPDPKSADFLRDLLRLDVYFRQQRGERPTIEQYVAVFPEQETILRQVFGDATAETLAGHHDALAHTPSVACSSVPALTFLQPSQGPGELGRLGPYRVLEVLGHGGMGMVLRAEHCRLGRQDAVKIMLPELARDPIARERFLTEARATARISNDHVVQIYQADECDGILFIAMPLLSGETLDRRLRSDKQLPVPDLFRVGYETALGLAAAHDAGLIHRDLKPSNLWLETDPAGGSFRRIIVLDFGLARLFEGSQGLTASGSPVGTPEYLSPEQAEGRALDGRSDLFSLGVVLYRAATGRRPFARDSLLATIRAVTEYEPPDVSTVNAAVPLPLCDLISQLLSKNPDDRPQSAAQVAAELAVLSEGLLPLPGDLSSRIGSGRQRRRPQRWMTFILVVGVLFLAAFVGWRAFPVSKNQQGRVVEAISPLRVVSLDVRHFAREPGGMTSIRGILGKESFVARPNDLVVVEAKLSRPAYAYLIAFRGDGTHELCFPEEEDQAPPLTNQPRYPSTSRGDAYGLAEGTGLWAFAVVASENPLPPYRDWAAQHPNTPWQHEAMPADQVWWDDGQWIECLTPGNTLRGDRAKGEKLPGQFAISGLADWLRSNLPGEAVGVVGFAVR